MLDPYTGGSAGEPTTHLRFTKMSFPCSVYFLILHKWKNRIKTLYTTIIILSSSLLQFEVRNLWLVSILAQGLLFNNCIQKLTKFFKDHESIGPLNLVECLFSIQRQYHKILFGVPWGMHQIKQAPQIKEQMSFGNKSSLVRVHQLSFEKAKPFGYVYVRIF